MKPWTVIQFPGSNCDYDAWRALERVAERRVQFHWWENPIEATAYSAIIIPGGFSFGDYLRAGAIAKISPAVLSLPKAVEAGAHVMGICNGFQILIEARLLPGFLHVNDHLRFISKTVECEISEPAFPWIRKEDVGRKVLFPIAHRFGNYQVAPVERGEMHAVLRYMENPNGSFDRIAGIYRPYGEGSFFGLMPHPERASFEEIGLRDGEMLWTNAARDLR